MGSNNSLDLRLLSHLEDEKPELFKLLKAMEDKFEGINDFNSELFFKILSDLATPFQIIPNSIKLAISQGLIIFEAEDEYFDRSIDFKRHIEERYHLSIPLKSLSHKFLANLVATDDLLVPAYECDGYNPEVIRLFNLVIGIINKAKVPLAPLTIKVLENVCRGYLEDDYELVEYRLYHQITNAIGFKRLSALDFSEDKVFRINSYLCAFIERKYGLKEVPLNPEFYREHFRVSHLNREITNRADFTRMNRSFINIGYQKALSRNDQKLS